MAQEEKSNNETAIETVGRHEKQGGAPWVGAGLGLVGGVVGALAITFASPFFQTESQDNIAPQIEAQATQIQALSARLEQMGEETSILNTDWEKAATRILDTLATLDNQIRQVEDAAKNADKTASLATEIGQAQETQLQDLTEATVSLTEEMDGLKNRLEQIEAQTVSSLNQLEQGQLGQEQVEQGQLDWDGQINTLKTQIEALERQIGTLPQIMQKLEAQGETFSTLIDGQNVSIESIVADMTASFEQQKQAIETLTRHVAEIKLAPPASDHSLAMLVAAQSLKTAIDRGGSYKGELQIFAPLAPATFSVELLEKYADSGLPNIAELTSRFTKLADEIAALDESLPEDASLTDQLLQQGSRLYSSRPVGEVEGNDSAAIAARMEVAIGQGDLTRALNEARNLSPEAKALGSDFLEMLLARENVDALLQRLIADLLQE